MITRHKPAWKRHLSALIGACGSQKEAAEALGVGTNTVHRWTTGDVPSRPHRERLRKVGGDHLDLPQRAMMALIASVQALEALQEPREGDDANVLSQRARQARQRLLTDHIRPLQELL